MAELQELTYVPEGVCCKGMKIFIETADNKEDAKIEGVTFYGGCPGNATGLGLALKGKTVKEVIELIKGIKCGNKPTSCPDQLSKALEDYLA